MTKSITAAGIDTAKDKLDIAVHGSPRTLQVTNDAEGWEKAARLLEELAVKRAGIEATGGYELGVVEHLRGRGIAVVVFQPQQVLYYARFRKRHIKNDKADARLIAECTTLSEPRDLPDGRLADLAGDLTYLEQIEEDIARQKCRLEHVRSDRVRNELKAAIADGVARRKREMARLIKLLRSHADLRRRYDLVYSVAGIGDRTALAIVVRMPEIGTLTREQAASLAGLAPFDDDSGRRRGPRHVQGGRDRLRRSLYAAAFAATFHWNDALRSLYERLTARGKVHRSALVACARKLIVYANATVRRDRMWTNQPAADAI